MKDHVRSTTVRYCFHRCPQGSTPRFEPRTSTNACGHVCRYVDRKSSAAMLTSIQSAGVAPEVNLRNSLHAGDKACKQGIHPGFEAQGRRCQKSKTEVSVAPREGFMSSKNKKKQVGTIPPSQGRYPLGKVGTPWSR